MVLNCLEKLSLAMNDCTRPSLGAANQELGADMIHCALSHANVAVTELMRSLACFMIGFIFPGVTYFFPPYYFPFQEGLLTRSAQEAVKHSDLFSSSSPLDKGTKARTKTVLSLFDEEEDKMEDQNTIQAPQKEVGKVSKKQ